MFRLVLLLLAGMSFFADAHAGFLDDLKAQAAARRAAMIEAGKMPPVRLSEKQMARLKQESPRGQIVWLGAGRQKDGKIFVCHVATGKDLIGVKFVNLHTGTFEADDSYEPSTARFQSHAAVLRECNSHGFEPPVSVTVRAY
jgi:hypothetical protein